MSLALLAPSADLLEGMAYPQAAYLVIFAALFGYCLRLQFAQRALRRRLEEAERRLQELTNEGR